MTTRFNPTPGALAVSAHQTDIARAIGTVSRAVAGRSTLPVLGNILIATDQGRLRFSATNLELSITCWIDGTVETEGAITLPAKTAVDLVNSLPALNTVLKLVENTQKVNVVCGRVKSNINGINANEFPPIPDTDLEQVILVDTALWMTAITRVIVAASNDEARPIMSGLLFSLRDGQATLVASDGFRLALDIKADKPGQTLSAIIPSRALSELNRILDPEKPLFIDLQTDNGQITFKNGDIQLTSQLIEGVFPEYLGILPKQVVTRTVCITSELRKLLKSVDVISREVAHTGRFTIMPGTEDQPGTLRVSGSAAETGDNTAEMDAIVTGPALTIAFNVKFFLDGLAGINTPTVALETTTNAAPGVLMAVGTDKEDGNYRYVLMPFAPG